MHLQIVHFCSISLCFVMFQPSTQLGALQLHLSDDINDLQMLCHDVQEE